MLACICDAAQACSFDVDCQPGSKCLKASGSIYGVCAGGFFLEIDTTGNRYRLRLISIAPTAIRVRSIILLTTSSHRGMTSEDRTYLVRLVSSRTGLAAPDAERRVDDVAARAKENIQRARRSAVILAFSAGAAALLGAAVAWFAACGGGRIRDGADTPWLLSDWGRSLRRT